MRHQDLWTGATLESTKDLTPSIREFVLRPDVDLPFYPPGSHINVKVMIDERPEDRSYSLVGSPTEEVVRIAVKALEHSHGGSRYMWSLRPGARLEISAPVCAFELLPGSPDYLLIAGGIGITPLISMASTLAKHGDHFRLMFAASTRAELAYAAALAAECGERLALFPSDERRMDIEGAIAELDPAGEAYVCGPMRMLDAARQAWDTAGRPATKLRYETFGSSGRYATQAFVVEVPRLGLSIEVPQSCSMLDALASAGITILADCKRGECGLCALDILATGGPIDHRDVFFSAAQHREGKKICPCVSRMAGGSIAVEAPFRGDCRPGPDIYAGTE